MTGMALTCLLAVPVGVRAQVPLFDGLDWVMDRGAINFVSIPGMPGNGPAGVPLRQGKNNFNLRVLNGEIMLRLQEAGIAALSDTTVKQRHCLRAAICNHRTKREDLDLVVREAVRRGNEILEEYKLR